MRTRPIITEINGVTKRVVYIEYINRLPHAVITCGLTDNIIENWDFDLNKQWGEFMHYETGGGGTIEKIQGPQFAEKGAASLWISKEVGFNKYKPKNCRILKNPIVLNNGNSKGTIDPFKFSYQKVNDIVYCKFCKGYFSEDGCPDHMNAWEWKYNDGSEIE